MTRPAFAPEAAADVLLDAYRAKQVLEELPEDIRPRTLAEGYDVQDRLIERLGQKVVGWKLGAGSPRARRGTGIDRPIAGRILADRVFSGGQPVEVAPLGPVTVEFEIAYVLGRAINSNDRLDNPLSAVTAAHAAFELVRSRFRDRSRVGWPSFAADNAAFEAFVLGPPLAVSDHERIGPTLHVTVDGVAMATAATGEDGIDPGRALTDFVALAQERRMSLPAGSIISTGTQSVPFQVAQTAEIVASYLDTSLALPLRFLS